MIAIALNARYLDRRGNVWTCTRITPEYRYPAWCVKSDGEGQSYTMDGRWTRHCEWMNDLVSEVVAVVGEVAA